MIFIFMAIYFISKSFIIIYMLSNQLRHDAIQVPSWGIRYLHMNI